MTDLFSSFELIFEKIRTAAGGGPVYLVGGAVRDAMLNRPVHDLDFVVPAGAGALARKVADDFSAAFYLMDKKRDTARVIHAGRMYDFAVYRTAELEGDLRARDFTINAMAVDLRSPDRLIDPLGGAGDLRQGLIRLCSPTALHDDPVRVLRAVRLATEHQFRFHQDNIPTMRAAAGQLAQVSAERQRDELFRMLGGARVASAVRLLAHFGVTPILIPEFAAASTPDQEHALAVVSELEGLLSILTGAYQPDKAANFARTAAVMRLGRFRAQLSNHFGPSLNPTRRTGALLMLAALLAYDRNPDRANRSTQQAALRGRAMALSVAEIDRLKAVVGHPQAFSALIEQIEPVSRRGVYRYFKTCQAAGVDIILLSLAGTLATSGAGLAVERWERELAVAQALLYAWWEMPAEQVRPPLLLTGRDMMNKFNLSPGPEVGDLLESLQEAQAAGEVNDREGALEFIDAQLHLK